MASLADGRAAFTVGGWAYSLAGSVGLDPFAEAFVASGLGRAARGPQGHRSQGHGPQGRQTPEWRRARAVELTLLRLVPLVEEGYHLVELGPRGTGKSYLYEELAPRARLLSGGKASVSKLFLDTRSGEKGLVADQDAIAFDEISSTDFRGGCGKTPRLWTGSAGTCPGGRCRRSGPGPSPRAWG